MMLLIHRFDLLLQIIHKKHLKLVECFICLVELSLMKYSGDLVARSWEGTRGRNFLFSCKVCCSC